MDKTKEREETELNVEELLSELRDRGLSNEKMVDYILETQNDKLAKTLWEEVTPEELNTKRLDALVCFFVPENVCEDAAEVLLDREIGFDELKSIIEYAEPYRNQAWELLREKDVDDGKLTKLFWASDKLGSFEEVIVNYFLENVTDTEILSTVVRRASSPHKKEVWKKMLANVPKKQELMWIIYHVSSLRKEAWEKLCQMGPNYEELKKVIDEVENSDILEEAAQRLLEKDETTTEDLIWLMKEMEFFQKEAWKAAIKNGLEEKNLVDIIIDDKCANLRKQAWRTLKDLDMKSGSLHRILGFLSPSSLVYKNAARMLLTEKKSKKNLKYLLQNVDFLQNKAWQEYKKDLTNEELQDLISPYSHFPDFTAKPAARKLLAREPDKNQLEFIFKYIKSEILLMEAWDQYIERHGTAKNLHKLLTSRHYPNKIKRKAAEKLLAMDPTEKQLKAIRDEVSSLKEEAEKELTLMKMEADELIENLEESM